MRIDLVRTLADATQTQHETTTITAEKVLARARRTRRNRLLRWLVPPLATVVALGLLIWFTPLFISGPLPAPSPSPAPSSEYHWDGTDPNEHLLSDAEVARRCHVTAKAEQVLADESTLQPGGLVKVIPAGTTVTRAKDGSQKDPPGTRYCQLGYDTTPTKDPVTLQEVSAPEEQLPAICERHAGLALTDPDWHLAASATIAATVNQQETRVAAFTSDSGWFAVCQLVAEATPHSPSSGEFTDQAVAQVSRLVEIEQQQPSPGCPTVLTYPSVMTSTGPQSQVTTAVEIVGSVPVMKQGRIDDSVTGVDMAGPKGSGLTAHLPVLHGIVLADQHITLARPMAIGANGAVPPITLHLRDAAGHVVRTCTTKN